MTPSDGVGNPNLPDPEIPATRTGQPTADPTASGRGRRVTLTAAASIAPRRATWLWVGRLAVGTLAILAGREGMGKSTLAYWIVAQITTGTLAGELHGRPAAVLIAATEDSWAYTIVPRLIAAGADLNLVHRVDVDSDIGKTNLSLPADVAAVGDAAVSTGAALLLLDPLLSRLSSGLDTHKDQSTRQALEPLTEMLFATRLVALGLMHFNKSGSDDPLDALMGSRAFSGVPRSVSTVVPDPDDPAGQRRLFGTPKNNLGPNNLPLLAFTLEPCGVPTSEGTAWTSRIVWGDEVAGSVMDTQSQSSNRIHHTVTDDACCWLEAFLIEKDGQADSAQIKVSGLAAGLSHDTLNRARKQLQVDTVNLPGFPRRTAWRLPRNPDEFQPPVAGSAMTAATATTGPMPPSHRSDGSDGSHQVGAMDGPEFTDPCPDCGYPLDQSACWSCAAQATP